MKISILSPNLSSNCLGRAYLLAKILQRRYEVEIVGPVFSDGIWKPLADDKSIAYKPIEIRGTFKACHLFWALVKVANGDVIYASKPFFLSYDVGLLKKWVSKKPLILDIDDWDLGFLIDGSKNPKWLKSISLSEIKRFLLWPDSSYLWTAVNERMARFADKTTVSNSFLQNKFGGSIIWHARDTADFDPVRFDKQAIRKRYGIDEDEKIVLFCGTPRPHKGIEDLIVAMRDVTKASLMFVGKDEGQYSQELISRALVTLGSGRVLTYGFQDFSKISEFLTMSNVVVIPQRKCYASAGQMPAKVFDAMSMAKPIIATNVSDLPEILKDCGWLVDSGDSNALGRSIQYVLDHPDEGEAMGRKARKKCIEMYSYNAMERPLCDMFKTYE